MLRAIMLFLFSLGLCAQMRIIPHLTRAGGGFTTNVIIENTGVTNTIFEVQPFDADGNALTIYRKALGSGEQIVQEASKLFGEDAAYAILVSGDVELSASFVAANGPGSPAQIRTSSGEGTRYRFFVGDWSQTFDGFAVVNMGDQVADVWVTQKNQSGGHEKSVKAINGLQPGAKALYVIGDPSGSVFNAEANDTFEIYCQQPIALTLLRGTTPGSSVGFLWDNTAKIMSTAQTSRDGLGVWFVEDGSLYDVYEAQGYNVATDRLYQADLFRHTARGKMASWFGPDFLDQDMFTRQTMYSTSELNDAFTNMDEESQTIIKAYVDGFNRRIGEVNSNPEIMPGEYTLLGFSSVDSWSVVDCLAWMAILQRNFDPMDYGAGQTTNAALFEDLVENYAQGIAMFEDLRYVNDPDAPTMIPQVILQQKTNYFAADKSLPDLNLRDWSDRFVGRLQRNEDLLKSVNAYVKGGSYAWVVSGDRTSSGNPILYSGPQMGFSLPSITIEGSVRGGGIHVSGMTVPGVPGIIVGRTPHHAWSMQVGHAHSSDLYIEPPGALGPGREEVIEVRGEEDVTVTVYRTNHGPVISETPLTAWQYANWGHELNAAKIFLDLARAQSMEEFGNALEELGVSQHFCYADAEGNIAYWMSGRDPIRPEGDYRFPQGLLSPSINFDVEDVRPLAHDSNPITGYFGGWNNKASADYPNAPYQANITYGPAHRAQVILDYFNSTGELTYEQIRDFAIDIAATDSFGGGGNTWAFVEDIFADAVNSDPTTARTEALTMIQNWDGHFVDGGALRWINGTDRADAWILQDLWIRKVIQKTFADELDDLDYPLLFNVLLHLMDPKVSVPAFYDWFTNLSDSSAPQVQTNIILFSLDEALAELGSQPWGEDQRGTIEYEHPLIMESFWSTPFGSRSTYVQCVEMGENGPTRIQSMFPLGQSGNILLVNGLPVLDPHFLDMAAFFDSFTPRNFPLFTE